MYNLDNQFILMKYQFVFILRLVDNGQLEIVTGGWVMTDEANTHYSSMITQLTNGHQWLMQNLNITAK